jgi:ribosomal protein L1
MSSKINNALVLNCIKEMRENSKARKFKQTVELQVSLKDYDP